MTEQRPSPFGGPGDPAEPARQFSLKFPAQPLFTFSSFIESPATAFAAASAKSLVRDAAPTSEALFISGPTGSGKTHLLLAMGNDASQTGVDSLFLSCRHWIDKLESASSEEALQWGQHIASHRLLLVDDVDLLSGKAQAQEVLYQVYNEIRENRGRLAMTSRLRPNELGKTEPFLVSRLQWGLTAELNPPGDDTLELLLIKLGQDRGLEIPQNVVQFLIQRLPRDYPSLLQAVEKINDASLSLKKKVTVGMVKSVLDL